MKKNSISLQSSAVIDTKYGSFNFATFTNSKKDLMPIMAVFTENTKWPKIVPIRIHSECMTGDLFGSKRCECGEQLHFSLAYLQEHGGLLIYLRQEGRGIGIIHKLEAYGLQDKGYNTAEANTILGFEEDQRHYDDVIDILNHFKINKIKLLTNNPDKINFFNSTKIEVVERVQIEFDPNNSNYQYLKTKKDHFGHLLTKL